ADGGTGEAGVAQSVALRPHQEFLSVGVRQKPTQSPYSPQGEESQPALTADLFFSTGEQVNRDEQQQQHTERHDHQQAGPGRMAQEAVAVAPPVDHQDERNKEQEDELKVFKRSGAV